MHLILSFYNYFNCDEKAYSYFHWGILFNEDYVDMFTRYNKKLQDLDLTRGVSMNIVDKGKHVDHLRVYDP